MSLLRADLRALANLPTTAAGRRMTVGMLTGLGLLALISWLLAEAISQHPRLVQLVADRSGRDALSGLLGYGLLACPMVATWLGLSMAQRQLFETPELWLWRQAPIPAWRGPMQVFLRSAFTSSLWASALSAPFLLALLQKSTAPPLAYALVPVAIVSCTVPLLAILLSIQIVLARFLSGRWLRLLLVAIAAMASVGFSLWLLLNLFTTGPNRIREVVAAADSAHQLPWTIDVAAAMLANAANRTLMASHWWPVLAWLTAAVAVFFGAAQLHARAHERYFTADAPLWRRSRRSWRGSLAANVCKKEFAQVLQQPGALIGFLVFAVLVFALANRRVLIGNILASRHLPREVAEVSAMLTLWFLAVLLVLYAHMGRLALWDGKQWPLYMASPAAPRTILRGKLTAVAVFLLWPLLLVATAGMQTLAVEPRTMWWFVGIAIGGTFAALGVLAVIGTWPRLMRPDTEGQIMQGGKSFLAAMVMVTTFELVLSPAWLGWLWLSEHMKRVPVGLSADTANEYAPWVLLSALGYGGLIATIGVWLGGRNYRRLLAPQ